MERQYRKEYKRFYYYLQNGIRNSADSRRIQNAYASFGHTDIDMIKRDFTWGEGAEIRIVDHPGGNPQAFGATLSNRNIEIRKELVMLLENAAPIHRDAILLVVISNLLHEETHRLNKLKYNENSIKSADDGDELIGLIYGDEARSVRFQGSIGEKDWRATRVQAAKKIIKEKEEKGEREDLPQITWSTFEMWLQKATQINPSIDVKRF